MLEVQISISDDSLEMDGKNIALLWDHPCGAFTSIFYIFIAMEERLFPSLLHGGM